MERIVQRVLADTLTELALHSRLERMRLLVWKLTRQQASKVRMMFRVRPWTTAVLAFVPGPVWSQPVEPPSEALEAVLVTGSRIPRLEFDRLQPTVVVTGDALESRGATNVVDVLSDIPAFGPPPSSAAGLQSSSFAVAQSYADFFSLGSQRTLTLVNGRRFVSSNTASIFGPVNLGQQVDLNAIPTKLIDSLEVVAVGGAPVYGSDAIAGTVNLILRRDFEGFDLDVLMGRSERGDGDNQRFRVLAGTNFAQDRGNVTINAEYLHSDGLVYMDRPRTARGLFYAPPLDPGSRYANELIESRRIPVINTGGLPMTADLIAHFAGIKDSSGNVMQFGPNGALVPYAFGTATGSLASASGGDGLDLNTVSNLLSPTERANFTLLGNFRVSERVNAYGEGWYSTTKGTRLSSQPSFNALVFGPAGTPDGNLIFSVDNPFLPDASRRLILDNLLAADADPSVFYLARANTDIQTGVARSETNLYRAVAGIEGSFEVGSHSVHWDISANYGNSQTKSREPQIVQQNFENALDAVLDAATGAVVCRGTLDGTLVSAPIETASAECAPLNLFGHGSPSKAARDYITTQARQTSRNTQRVIAANISGDVVDLPAGPVNAVLGLESRRETSEFDPDRFYREALGRLVAIEGLRGEFETEEVFTELLIPLVGKGQGIPFVHALQVEGAARYVDHSIAGGDLTWTAGGRFAPVPDIQFRGNKTRAIRSGHHRGVSSSIECVCHGERSL